MRKKIRLHEDWLFHKGDIPIPRPTDKGPVYAQSKTERKLIGPAAYHYYDRPDSYGEDGEIRSEGWIRVNLPHDYIIDQDNVPSENNALGYLHYDNAWYRKRFFMDEGARGKRVTLEFDGIAGQSTIYLNGCRMRHNYSSYNSFEVDISDNIYVGRENVLAIYVNTEEFEGWWYQGGGIYRDVRLLIAEPLSIDRYGVYAPARKADEEQWVVDFQTTVRNDSFKDRIVTVKSEIIDQTGRVAAQAAAAGKVVLRDKATLFSSAKVQAPYLWDTESPYLYTVRTSLFVDDILYDENTVRIGFRTVEADARKGLLINGKPTIIKGVCCHQDFGLTGLAVPDNIVRYKIGLIKEMGANGFRCSHYAHSAASMDTFDELGFLVMNETRWFESTEESMEQLDMLVRRDRNRPSVIIWSTSNEEPYHITDVGGRIHKAMATCIRKLDDTRLITAAQSHAPDQSFIYDDCDIIGVNYNLDLYDGIHTSTPNKAILSTECCATGSTRDWHFPPNNSGRLRDKDRDTNDWFRGRERTWKFLMERPYVIGGYQWAAVEHRGEAQWPAICSKSGAIDFFLQLKGAFYQNQSLWTENPMVHIVPHWNFKGLENEEIPVTVYTNCEELELFLSGISLGRKAVETYGHGEWSVKYIAGELSVKGYRNGEPVAEDIRHTSKTAAGLVLRLDNEVRANGEDLALFTCECVDEDGRIVPDAAEFVRFSASEPARLVATGSDHCDHNAVSHTARKMYCGKITVAVRPQKGQSHLELYAQSDACGLSKICISLE